MIYILKDNKINLVGSMQQANTVWTFTHANPIFPGETSSF